MELSTLHHVGLVVSDLDRSIWFYHDVLGLSLANEPTPWFEGPALAQGVGVPDARLRQVSLSTGQGVIVELIEYGVRAGADREQAPNDHVGAGHLCFRVPDIRAARAELESHGIAFYSDVNVIDEGPLAGWRWCYFDDPDGSTLELVEVVDVDHGERDAAVAAYLRSRPSLAVLESRPT